MADLDDSNAALSRRAFCGLAGGSIAAMGYAAPATATKTATSELVMMDATTLAATIRARRTSCTEVMTAFLDHIDRHNPMVNAIVARQDRAMLMAEAGRQDDLARRGEWLGALHGFPHAVKDLQPVKGIVSTRGSQIFRDHVPAADGLMVERLRRAGAIFIGKTNVPEFGLGSHSYNAVYGTTRNPYDTTRSAGGSSGGAGAALAMRMLPVADGSDFGGSLRNPAAWNNVIGFRTGFGRVATSGDDVWFPGMSVLGPMARTIPDLALLLKVQSGHEDRAPLSMEGDSLDLTGGLAADPKGKRVGWLGDFGGAVPTEPAVLAQCGEALKALAAMGCTIEDAVPDMSIEPVWQAQLKLRAWLAGGGIADLYAVPETRRQMKPEAIYEVENGLKLSAFDLRAASVVRSQWYNAVRKLFARYDYLIAPATQVVPFDAKLDWPHEINGQTMRSYHEWQKGNFLITMSGCPSLAVPAGFTINGLPVGIQIVAPVTHELACLQLGHAYMQANDWTAKRLPPQLA
ncbi:MAG: amidase [Sphingobium sp.]